MSIGNTMAETVTISKTKYQKLKRQANIDAQFVKELVGSIKDIKAGRVRKVR